MLCGPFLPGAQIFIDASNHRRASGQRMQANDRQMLRAGCAATKNIKTIGARALIHGGSRLGPFSQPNVSTHNLHYFDFYNLRFLIGQVGATRFAPHLEKCLRRSRRRRRDRDYSDRDPATTHSLPVPSFI